MENYDIQQPFDSRFHNFYCVSGFQRHFFNWRWNSMYSMVLLSKQNVSVHVCHNYQVLFKYMDICFWCFCVCFKNWQIISSPILNSAWYLLIDHMTILLQVYPFFCLFWFCIDLEWHIMYRISDFISSKIIFCGSIVKCQLYLNPGILQQGSMPYDRR
jgi:hypothetical protein